MASPPRVTSEAGQILTDKKRKGDCGLLEGGEGQGRKETSGWVGGEGERTTGHFAVGPKGSNGGFFVVPHQSAIPHHIRTQDCGQFALRALFALGRHGEFPRITPLNA